MSNFLSGVATIRFQEGLVTVIGALLCLQKLAPTCGADAIRHAVKVEEDGLVTALIRNDGNSRSVFVVRPRPRRK